MNIIICLFIIGSALFMRVKYRPRSQYSRRLFAIAMFMGAVSLFAVHSFSGVLVVMLSLLEAVCIAAVLLIYRAQARSEAACRARRRHEEQQRRQVVMCRAQRMARVIQSYDGMAA